MLVRRACGVFRSGQWKLAGSAAGISAIGPKCGIFGRTQGGVGAMGACVLAAADGWAEAGNVVPLSRRA